VNQRPKRSQGIQGAISAGRKVGLELLFVPIAKERNTVMSA